MTEKPIKVGIISGFLGSGKTTTLIEVGKLLDSEYDLKSAILMNDIGAAPVDSEFLEGLGIQAKRVQGKCICCTLGPSFRIAMKSIQDNWFEDEEGVVLIEPTGIAIPYRVKGRFTEVFGEGWGSFEIAPLIVLVDGYKFLDFVDTIDELIERQTKDVEYIMINKMDLIDDKEKLGKIKEIIHRINPDAEIREMSAKFGEGIREIVNIIMKETLGHFELKEEGGSSDIDV